VVYEFAWDEARRTVNLAKHGVDFVAVAGFDWETAVFFPDDRRDYGEARMLAYGLIDGRLHALVFTRRGAVHRLISLRRANRREEAIYHAGLLR